MRRALILGVASVWALTAVACAASAEEQTLLKFFEAARTLDRAIIDKYATVGFNPRTDGIVQTFTVTDAGQDREGRKDVTIDAVVRDPSGATTQRTYVVTFQAGVITGLRQIPASRTSREASSDRPS